MSLSPSCIGTLPVGARNSTSNVAGVTVDHAMVAGGNIQTDVTVVRPHVGGPFVDKVPATNVVLSGFGESISLVQVGKLDVLEMPIALANVFAAGVVTQMRIRRAAVANPQIDRAWSTIDPLVFECNGGYLNDLQALAVQEVYYDAAYAVVVQVFEQGAVGAGRGMSSSDARDGTGSISCTVTLADSAQCTVGAFVLSDSGATRSLTLDGHDVGTELVSALTTAVPEPEKGSIITLVATDAPLDARRLYRLALHAGIGLARIGSVLGHSSDDITLVFSAACTVSHEDACVMLVISMTHESHLDPLFQVTTDSVEQVIVHALFHATAVTSRDDDTRRALVRLL